ncbi:DNA repair protein RadC [Ruminococcaceae bacterium OttesenSCG-928-I18]|nr:DNA repair protein RadC [Ruminococcaceae bacterium OttesenSCG-928-I18]
MGVHDGHRDRLRARFLKEGIQGFEEHTALELLLFYARPRCDTNEIAHALIRKFGNFSAVLDAPMEELTTVDGVGENTATLLKLIPELGAYYLESRGEAGDILNTTEKAGTFFLPKFFGKGNEEVYLACLDDKRKLLRSTCISKQGIVNAVSISTRKIVAEAVRSNATGAILAHNHPGGLALPSANDKLVTKQVFQALRYVSVSLLDHIIVADGDFVSMADSGFFESLGRDSY